MLLLLLLLLAACGDTPGDVLPDPRDGRSGVRFSGIVNDRQVAVSDGLPEVNFGDCDINQGSDRDVCIITEDVNGDLVVIVFENPDVLIEDTSIRIGDTPCADPQACDEVTETALVDVQVGTGPRVRAVSGNLDIEVVVPLARYRGEFDLRLPDGGTLNATFDLVPRPEEISAHGATGG